jgi:phosphoribosylformimino-5-aminoimidazole carboxamide ribotide isomerase
MQVIPAIDVRDGACVQLVGGDYAAERIRLPDPVAVAARWLGLGYPLIHVVDLDAATGKGDNAGVIARILERAAGRAQVGGGIRRRADAARWLDLGAARVVVGSMAFDAPWTLGSVARAFPGRIVVAADVRDGALVAGGWTRTVAEPLDDALARFETLPLAALLVTAVHREGRMEGVDAALIARVVRATRHHPVIAAGGIGSPADLEALARAGAAAAVVGMALYTGRLAAAPVAGEWNR